MHYNFHYYLYRSTLFLREKHSYYHCGYYCTYAKLVRWTKVKDIVPSGLFIVHLHARITQYYCLV